MTTLAASNKSQDGRRGLHPAALPLAIILAATAIHATSYLTELLEFNRIAIYSGQWWRLITCHLTHWSWLHAAGDIVSFGILWWMMGWSVRRSALLVVATSLTIGAIMMITSPGIMIYRGMSGVNYGMIGAVLVTRSDSLRYLRLLSLCLVTAKIFFETLASPGSIWMPSDVAVVGTAHAAGLMTGLLASLAPLSKYPGGVPANRESPGGS